MRSTRRNRQAGLTLMEVMIASAVMVVMMALAWKTISNTSDARRTFEHFELRNHELRMAMNRVVADFEFEGKDLVWKLLIRVSRFSLRRDRNRAFDRYVVAIEKEFASPSAPSPGSANSSVAADRAPSA